jgi:hypothetical protein
MSCVTIELAHMVGRMSCVTIELAHMVGKCESAPEAPVMFAGEFSRSAQERHSRFPRPSKGTSTSLFDSRVMFETHLNSFFHITSDVQRTTPTLVI